MRQSLLLTEPVRFDMSVEKYTPEALCGGGVIEIGLFLTTEKRGDEDASNFNDARLLNGLRT